jgi:uncharacterized protein (TIGR00730 family)
MMKSAVVFCGASEGYNEVYRETAYEVGSRLAAQGIEVIYGGGRVGLMGAVADGALAQGGKVTGIIPYFLHTKEIAHTGVQELITVKTMHERKLLMHQRSEAVIALPGGWGTFEELFEMITWAQLGLHRKPICLLNKNGYYDPLKAMFSSMVQEGFLTEQTHSIVRSADTVDELMYELENYTPHEIPKWLSEKLV